MQQRLPYWLSLCLLFLFLTSEARAQDSTNTQRRKAWVVGVSSVGYVSTMTGLYNLWYKDYPSTSFHFFNDNANWLQMDKVGHTYSCYYEGLAGIKMMQWAGFTDKQSAWIGGSLGFFVQTTVEVFDGFSEAWGASWGDVVANAAGTGLAIGQELKWGEQRIVMKYGYTPSDYAQYRPNVLGSNLPEKVMKDYNAQTYWMSVNVNSFLKEDSKWPKWLNIAAGYGADGMVGGEDNRFLNANGNEVYYGFSRSRQFYLGPDIDLSRIETDKAWLKTSLFILNCIKFPTPCAEFHTAEGMQWHWLSL